jgi:2-polyprenyl-3-methyl-5-hydroxy-6-metoxy-1,4-benzoquinol methylase
MAGPWNHNTHHHPHILAAVPRGARRALDVGCGAGTLAGELAARIDEVDAIDRDPEVIARASARIRAPNIRFSTADFLALGARDYDLVTMVAVLHHMPLERALEAIADALAPGGVCAVIGLSRTRGLEHLASFVSWPLSQWLRRRRPHAPVCAPIADPRESFTEIRRAASRILPGAVLRRRLFWRYTLVWTKR